MLKIKYLGVIGLLFATSLHSMAPTHDKTKEELTEKTISLANTKNFEELSKLLKANPGLIDEVKNKANQTLLHHAARTKNHVLAQTLLKNGANLSLKDTDDFTPLTHAVLGNDTKMVELLLEAGADINEQERDTKQTPLHTIADLPSDKQAMLEFLLKKGADINKQSTLGNTPLHMAVGANKLDTVRTLLEHDARTDLETKHDKYIPLEATQDNDIGKKIADMLIEHNKKTLHGQLLLHHAAKTDKTRIGQLLIAKGFNVNQQNPDGATPLHIAAQNNKYAMAKLLLDNGADATIPDQSGKKPSQYATDNHIKNLLKNAESSCCIS